MAGFTSEYPAGLRRNLQVEDVPPRGGAPGAQIEQAIGEFLPTWDLAPIVEALQALRGVELVTAVTFAVEMGDVGRFESPAN